MLIKPAKKKFWLPGIAPYYKVASGGAAFPTLSGLVLARYTAKTGVSLSGSNVTALADQSASAANLTTAASPTYSATGFNAAFPGIAFNGTSQYLVTANRAIASGGTATMSFWMVFSPTATPAAFGRFLSTIGTTVSGSDFSGSDSGVPFGLNNTAAQVCGFASAGATPLAATAITYGNNYELAMVFDGTNTTLYSSNVLQAQTANTAPARWGVSGLDLLSLAIGGKLTNDASGNIIAPNTDSWGKMTVAEVVMMSGVFSSGDRTALASYRASNWGF